MGNEDRGTAPDRPVEGMLMETANAEPATPHRGVVEPAATRGDDASSGVIVSAVIRRSQLRAWFVRAIHRTAVRGQAGGAVDTVDSVAGSEFLDDRLDFG